MINYIVEAVLIEKQHLIYAFSFEDASPSNVIISSLAAPVRFNFAYRRCTWYSNEKIFSNGTGSEHAIDFGFSKSKSEVKKWALDNKQKEFVAFVRLRSGETYVIGSNKVGLELTYNFTIFNQNTLLVMLGGTVDLLPIRSSYGISDFFVGRDFNDDFNIDFG